ncbi:MAG: ribosome assembly cofactor RimP [Porphyromonadaceae bacterium]|nr:ribosome assembly cofactor RimP [Porphyromonadaceae bacterium]
MISQQTLEEIVQAGIAGTDLFVVEITLSADNHIVVEVDNDKGVDIDQCTALHRFIESRLDRDVEDYDLEVGSAGLTSPFKVVRQYEKNIGHEVEVLTRKGEKLTGTLKAADEKGFTLALTRMVKAEGSKRKTAIEEERNFLYSEIKYTKYLIRFK